jgi:2-keto-4-pentenoate hydratase/2-oxohepta-3-ene-1,7-dioic acid hydratase in catechol pathway
VKLVTYKSGKELRLGALDAEKGILDVQKAGRKLLAQWLPETMRDLIEAGDGAVDIARETLKAARADCEGLWQPLAATALATPLPHPRKNIFCVGRNYKAHIAEMARSLGREPDWPKVPEFFSKPPTTVVGPEDGVERHADHTERLDYEVELAVVIGKKGRNIAEQDALSHIFGYTVVNDITARDAQLKHHQFFKGKSFDTFCPIGPCVVTSDEFGDPGGHRLTLKVNGNIRQDSNTSDLLFGVPKIIEALSWALTLEPGDIIATGTPHGVAAGMKPPGWLQVGDVVEAEVEGIGVLRNRIVP